MTAFSNRLPRMAVFGAMAVTVSLVSAHASAGSLDDSLDLVADCVSYQATHRNGAILLDETTAV